MAKGRKPKPDAIKKIDGNPGKRPIREKQPVAGKWNYRGRPQYLSLLGKETYANLVDLLGPRGMQLLDKSDKLALEMLAETYSEWRNSNEQVMQLGIIQEVETKQGGTMLRQNPAVSIRADSAKRLISMLAEFGLTPSSRSRLLNNQGEGDDPLLDILKNRNQINASK